MADDVLVCPLSTAAKGTKHKRMSEKDDQKSRGNTVGMYIKQHLLQTISISGALGPEEVSSKVSWVSVTGILANMNKESKVADKWKGQTMGHLIE